MFRLVTWRLIKMYDWYPMQTCPICLKQYDPVDKLINCPKCEVKLEVRKPKVKKGIQL